jgi:hypothetical protein
MSNEKGIMKGIISQIYQGFFLRDVLSFVIPGVIIIISLLLIFGIPRGVVTQLEKWFPLILGAKTGIGVFISIGLLTIIFGMTYVVGFLIQAIGINILKFIRFYKMKYIEMIEEIKNSLRINNNLFNIYDPDNCNLKKYRGLHCRCYRKYRYYQVAFYIIWQEFLESATEEEKNISERCTILKQMTGNVAIAIFIILIIYRWKHFNELGWNPIHLPTIIFILLIFMLLLEHHHQIDRQFDWRMAVLGRKYEI